MLKFIARRLLLLVPILFGLSLLSFAFVRALLPGVAAQELLGDKDRSDVRVTSDDLGADGPVWVQYGRYIGHVVAGDLGHSDTTGRPVTAELGEKLPASLELAAVAAAVALISGMFLGFRAGKRSGGAFDRLSRFLSLLGIGLPFFFVALVLRYVFAVRLGWLPEGGRLDPGAGPDHPTNLYALDAIVALDWSGFVDVLKHILLPAAALATIPLAVVFRTMRAATMDVLTQDYVLTALSKGLDPGTVDRRHIFKNAFLPMIATTSAQVGLLFTGAILVEPVFAWDGLGGWMFGAIVEEDHAILHAGLLLAAVVVVIVRLLADVARALLDPRIRYP